jgi:hypothetical protein
MKLKTLALASAAVLGLSGAAYAQSGMSPNSNSPGQMQNDRMGAPGTTGQGRMDPNWKNDRAPGNPQVHDATGNAGNTPPPAGGDDGRGRANSHTQE